MFYYCIVVVFFVKMRRILIKVKVFFDQYCMSIHLLCITKKFHLLVSRVSGLWNVDVALEYF